MQASEGTIPFRGHETWYRIVGDAEEPGRLPLLCLHGGPGFTHYYLEPLEALAEHPRVIFYDQLGCGRCCRHDECTPGHLEEMHRRITGSQLVIIEDASHLCFAEQPSEFNKTTNSFFDRTDRVSTP